MESPGHEEWQLDDETRRFLEEELVSPAQYIRALSSDPEHEDEPSARGPGPEAGAPETAPVSPQWRISASAAPESVVKSLEKALGLTVTVDSQGASQSGTAPPATEQRYIFEGELAVGGSGRVLHVFDQDMHRLVAMKVLRDDQQFPRSIGRFLEEARATGQLEHPNIPPVYDMGVHPDYGPYFTLRLVRGRTLRDVLRDLAIGRIETLRHFTLTRLIQILEQVAMGIHYAHVRGVIHRDLKPENIMMGDFGEVLVMDWGLAKISTRKPDSSRFEAPLLSDGTSRGKETVDGTVSGTLSYMSPEQARGWVEEIDVRTDVFGLGAVLYEILTYHPPYEGSSVDEILTQACAGEIAPPRTRAPRNVIPPELEAVCLRALAVSKDERHPDAMAFHEDLQVFLDGTLDSQRRKKEAGHLLLEGKQKAREYRRLTLDEDKLRREAQERLDAFQPHDPVSLKEGAWELHSQAAEVTEKRIRTFSDATAALHSAINIDDGNTEAKETLAELYWQRFEEAEQAGRKEEMAIYRHLVERYQQGKFTTLLEGTGHWTVISEPPGAIVLLHPVEDRGWRLVEGEGRWCGTTPLNQNLPVGHYTAVLKREGYRDTRAPLFIRRGERQLVKASLYRDEEIGAGFLLVPQGEFTVGGDSDAPGSLPLGRRFVGDFFISQYPVTFRDYCRFLDDLRAAGDPELEQWLPAVAKEGECVRFGSKGCYEPAVGALDIDPATADRFDEGFEWDLPVIGVSWFAALRYAEWMTEKRGQTCRLPRDLEWEKAARGVGGLIYPWGSRFDWSLVKGGLSRPERAQPEPIGAFPTDCSVYGVKDLAGTIREWCADWFLEGKYRLTRGAHWNSSHAGAFRAAQRSGLNPSTRSSAVGFRVVVEPHRRGKRP